MKLQDLQTGFIQLTWLLEQTLASLLKMPTISTTKCLSLFWSFGYDYLGHRSVLGQTWSFLENHVLFQFYDCSSFTIHQQHQLDVDNKVYKGFVFVGRQRLRCTLMGVGFSVTRLGYIWMVLVKIFLRKEAQTFGNLLDSLKMLLLCKNWCGNILGNVCENWATFHFSIWSRWFG